VKTDRPMPDVDRAITWLQNMYGATTQGWITLFSVDRETGKRRVEWVEVDRIPALLVPIGTLGARGDVWFGVAPRTIRLDGGARGGATMCDSIPALWLDIDIAGPAHRLPGLPGSKEQAVTLISRFPYQPTSVIQSGYGLQCWWRFKEPLSAVKAVPLLTRWQVTWEKLAGEHGVHLDNVSNIDRVMRLVGTFNFKLDKPVPVLGRSHWGVAYNPSDIEDFLEPLPTPEEREAKFSTGHLAGSRFNERVTGVQILRSLSWIPVRKDRRSGDYHWRHPLATNEVSATVYGDDGHTAIWSETVAAATGCPLRQPLDPFGLYTWLFHHGDFKAAHADLVEKGFRDLGDDPAAKTPPIRGVKTVPLTAGLRLVTRLASEITPVTPEWHWRRWLPKGKLVILEGDPSVGKSTVSLDLAARLTVGAPMPDRTPGSPASNVVVLSAEDDPDDTTSWRLRAAGADLDRVIHVEAITDDKNELSPIVLPLNVNLLWAKVEESKATLAVVDVLSSYLGSEVDAHKDADVRRALQPLVDMARATKVTVILLRHLRKENAGKAIYQGNGSIGIAGVARAVHHIGYHPEDATLRVLAAVKVNTEARPDSLGFRLLPHETMPCTYVEWGETVNFSADDLIAGPAEGGGQRDLCRQAIRELLPVGIENEMPSHEFLSALKELGFPKATIDRARDDEKVQARQFRAAGQEGIRGWMVHRPRKEPFGLIHPSESQES
jgi:hypothetical protein